VSAQVTANAIANVALAMRRNGRAAISIDFEDDCNTGPRMWDFETGTAEGWAFDVVTAGTGDAHVGVPTASSALAQSGTRSLALGFNGVNTTESNFVFVKVPLCASGQALDLAGKRIQAYVRLVTAAGSPPLDFGQGHLVALFTAPTTSFGGVDFSVNPATGGGDTPGSWYFVDGDLSSSFGDISAITHLGFRFLTNGPWTGTVYVDNIRLF
jgi:hypothetical protein